MAFILLLLLSTVLLLPHPQGAQAFSCISNFNDKGDIVSDYTEDCGEYQMCFTLSFWLDKYYTQYYGDLKGCQKVSTAVLHCLKDKLPNTVTGNCWKIGLSKGAWDLAVEQCYVEVRQGTPPLVPSRSGEAGFLEMYTCNHDFCNQYGCNCDDNFGLCGSGPCPHYKCYCEGLSPANNAIPFAAECTNHQRECWAEKGTGCYTLSQEGYPELYRDCAHPTDMVNCIHKELKDATGNGEHGDCVKATNAQWYDAATGCGWKDPDPNARQLPNKDRTARIKACRCTEEFCNKGGISWNDKDTERATNTTSNLDPLGPGCKTCGQKAVETGTALLVMAAAVAQYAMWI